MSGPANNAHSSSSNQLSRTALDTHVNAAHPRRSHGSFHGSNGANASRSQPHHSGANRSHTSTSSSGSNSGENSSSARRRLDDRRVDDNLSAPKTPYREPNPNPSRPSYKLDEMVDVYLSNSYNPYFTPGPNTAESVLPTLVMEPPKPDSASAQSLFHTKPDPPAFLSSKLARKNTGSNSTRRSTGTVLYHFPPIAVDASGYFASYDAALSLVPEIPISTLQISRIEGLLWWYLDASNTIQGPHPTSQMREWYIKGSMNIGLSISTTQNGPKIPLYEWFQSGRPAFLDALTYGNFMQSSGTPMMGSPMQMHMGGHMGPMGPMGFSPMNPMMMNTGFPMGYNEQGQPLFGPPGPRHPHAYGYPEGYQEEMYGGHMSMMGMGYPSQGGFMAYPMGMNASGMGHPMGMSQVPYGLAHDTNLKNHTGNESEENSDSSDPELDELADEERALYLAQSSSSHQDDEDDDDDAIFGKSNVAEKAVEKRDVVETPVVSTASVASATSATPVGPSPGIKFGSAPETAVSIPAPTALPVAIEKPVTSTASVAASPSPTPVAVPTSAPTVSSNPVATTSAVVKPTPAPTTVPAPVPVPAIVPAKISTQKTWASLSSSSLPGPIPQVIRHDISEQLAALALASTPAPAPAPVPTPAKPAWGGVASAVKPPVTKSFSEIQREEAELVRREAQERQARLLQQAKEEAEAEAEEFSGNQYFANVLAGKSGKPIENSSVTSIPSKSLEEIQREQVDELRRQRSQRESGFASAPISTPTSNEVAPPSSPWVSLASQMKDSESSVGTVSSPSLVVAASTSPPVSTSPPSTTGMAAAPLRARPTGTSGKVWGSAAPPPAVDLRTAQAEASRAVARSMATAASSSSSKANAKPSPTAYVAPREPTEEELLAIVEAAERGLQEDESEWQQAVGGRIKAPKMAMTPVASVKATKTIAPSAKPTVSQPKSTATTTTVSAKVVTKPATITVASTPTSVAVKKTVVEAEDGNKKWSISRDLENWCREKLLNITGSDDITIINFVMTLEDEDLIRDTIMYNIVDQQFTDDFMVHRGFELDAQKKVNKAKSAATKQKQATSVNRTSASVFGTYSDSSKKNNKKK